VNERTYRRDTFPTRLILLIKLFAIAVLIASPSISQPLPKPGTVYVFHAIDTEAGGMSAFVYSKKLDFIDFDPGGRVALAMTDSVRNMFLDSDSGRVKFTWFGLTHEAYLFSTSQSGTVVFDELNRYDDRMKEVGDMVGWHYHHADWNNPKDTSANAGCWKQSLTFNGTAYMHGSDIELAEQMVAMLILDKGYYPSVFRAGWTWESSDFSVWLDDVVPFDFSNTAPLTSSMPHSMRDTSGGRYDWSKAPSDWTYYHPDSADYQKAGHLKRTMFRCFPGHKSIDLNFFEAFKKAKAGENVLVGAYVHSFDDIAQFCRITTSTLRNTAQSFFGIRYKFVTALEGARMVLGLADEKPPEVQVLRAGKTITVVSDKPLFCYPYGAIKDMKGGYHRVRPRNLTPDTSHKDYRWTFNLGGTGFSVFAAGCVDVAGNTVVTPKYLP
jgi:hypothetical protein